MKKRLLHTTARAPLTQIKPTDAKVIGEWVAMYRHLRGKIDG